MTIENLSGLIVKYGFPLLGGLIAGPNGALIAKELADALNADNVPAKIADALTEHPRAKAILCDANKKHCPPEKTGD